MEGGTKRPTNTPRHHPEDIDTAILSATSQRAFINAFAAKGCEFKFTGEGGKPLKYPGLKPPGDRGFFQFDKLGRGYTQDIGVRLTGKFT